MFGDHDDQQAPHLATGLLLLTFITIVGVVATAQVSGIAATTVVGILAGCSTWLVFWLAVAQPTVEALGWSKAVHDVDLGQRKELIDRVQAVEADRDRSDRKVQRLGGILAATQHELNREITMMGFAVDDVVDDMESGSVGAHATDQLKVAFDHVEEGQRNVAALSRLGTSDRTDRVSAFKASDIAPLTVDADLVIERDEPIHGDADLWRLFVKNAARNSEAHGKANVITLSSGGGRLTIVDDGNGCTTADLDQAWKAGLRPNGTRSDGTKIMRRVAEAHGASVTLHGEIGSGVRIDVDLRDLEIDLRRLGTIDEAITTPHKASGGRLAPSG